MSLFVQMIGIVVIVAVIVVIIVAVAIVVAVVVVIVVVEVVVVVVVAVVVVVVAAIIVCRQKSIDNFLISIFLSSFILSKSEREKNIEAICFAASTLDD